MEATNLRFGDKLEGASNIIPWKVRVSLILMENGMWEFVDNKLTPPKNVAKLVAYNQKDENYLRCGEGSWITHLSEKNTTREMWGTLTKQY